MHLQSHDDTKLNNAMEIILSNVAQIIIVSCTGTRSSNSNANVGQMCGDFQWSIHGMNNKMNEMAHHQFMASAQSPMKKE